MQRFQNYGFVLGTVLLASFSLGCSGGDSSDHESRDRFENANPNSSGGDASSSTESDRTVQNGNVVTIMDHGLRMPRSQMILPPGWQVNQNIATDPNSGQILQFVLDRFGPNGELFKATPPAQYFAIAGQDFQQLWRAQANYALQSVLENVQIGRLGPSQTVAQVPTIQEMSRAMRVDALEAPVQGMIRGEAFSGRIYVANIPFPQDPHSGTFALEVLICPTPRLEQTVQTYLAIARTEKHDPQYQQRMQQISQQAMRQSQASHQQRMANNQAQFNAHQQRMQSQSQANDQRNQQWMNNFRGSNSSGGGSGYSSQNAYIDGIHEQQTFADPYSGQHVQQSGQYQYNFTDGQGNFYGTDDPSFSPSTLEGNWQQTQPLQANPYYSP